MRHPRGSDARGHTPPEAFHLLVELLDDNDNAENAFEDGAYLGVLLRTLAATHCVEAGASRIVMEQVTRHLRLDQLHKSHGRVLSRAALQALTVIELGHSQRAVARAAERAAEVAEGWREAGVAAGEGGGAVGGGGVAAGGRGDNARGRDAPPSTASWATYWHYERHGQSAALRLAAADSLLRLSLLLQPHELPHFDRPFVASGDDDEDGENGFGIGGGEGANGRGNGKHGAHEGGAEAAAARSVLVLALRLSDGRAHSPLEQLWLWNALGSLLTDAAHSEAVKRQASLFEVRGCSTATAAVEMTWHLMTSGSAGHVRARRRRRHSPIADAHPFLAPSALATSFAGRRG